MFEVSGSGFRVRGSGFSGSGFRVRGCWCFAVRCVEFGVQGAGVRGAGVSCSVSRVRRFAVRGFALRVRQVALAVRCFRGSGFQVQGFKFWISRFGVSDSYFRFRGLGFCGSGF